MGRDDEFFLKNFDDIVERAAHRIAHNPTEHGRNAVNDLYRLAFAQKNYIAQLEQNRSEVERLRSTLERTWEAAGFSAEDIAEMKRRLDAGN